LLRCRGLTMAGPELLSGTVLAGYRIVELVGRGGMGVVYRAEEPVLGRSVALKVLSPRLAADQDFRRRFLREMQVAASIEHPNILPVYRAGEEGGLLYLAMRYVQAPDLRQVLQRHGPLDAGRAVWIVDQVARALDAAHHRGLVHRDVKPGNVLLAAPATPGEPEHVYLADFGLTRPTAVDSSITRAGMFIGTPSYAAPEQLGNQPLDGRTDVYALGCVLYECLAGRPPFTAERDQAVLFAHVGADPPKVSQARPELPPAMDGVVERALAKAREDRYQSCPELATAARAALQRRLAPAGYGAPDPAPASRPEPAPARTRGERAGRVADRVGHLLGVALSAAQQARRATTPPPGGPPSGPPGAAPPRARQDPLPGPADEPAPRAHRAPSALLLAYQPLRRPAARLRRSLWLAVAVATVGVAVNLDDTAAARFLRGEPPDASAPSDLAVGVSLVQAGVFVLTAVLFLTWFRRAYANAAALGAGRLRFAGGWAVAGWLVPVFSLFRPKQLLNDVWRASDPELPADAGDAWRGRPVPALLGWWWLAFLASILARSVTVESVHAVTAFMTFGLLSHQLDRVEPSAGAQAFADLLTVLAGLLALRVVRRTTRRQEARAARLAGLPS
jgi:hypothetical protein